MQDVLANNVTGVFLILPTKIPSVDLGFFMLHSYHVNVHYLRTVEIMS